MVQTPTESLSMGIIEEIDHFGTKVTALKTALELDLFTVIASGNQTAATISSTTDCNQRAMSILLEALCSLGLLTKVSGNFYLTPTARTYLVKGNPGYCVPIYLTWLQNRERFTEFVRTGKPGVDLTSPEAEECWVGYAAQERIRWPLVVERLENYWRQLNLPDRTGLKVLDIGCGAGHKVFALARLDPTIQLTCLDSPRVLEVTEDIAGAMGVTDQVTFVAGDLSQVLPEAEFDLAIIGSLLHYFSPETCVQILRKTKLTLKPGGKVLIFTGMLDEERTNPERLLAALDISNCGPHGQVYTFSDYRRMLEQAGYRQINRSNEFMVSGTVESDPIGA